MQAPKPGHADTTAHRTLAGRLYPVNGSHHFCACHVPHGNLHYPVNILTLKPICPSPGDSPRQSRDRNSVIMVSLLSGPRSRLQFCSSKEDLGLDNHRPPLALSVPGMCGQRFCPGPWLLHHLVYSFLLTADSGSQKPPMTASSS